MGLFSGVLQRHVQTLREQREPSIDDLLTIVRNRCKRTRSAIKGLKRLKKR